MFYFLKACIVNRIGINVSKIAEELKFDQHKHNPFLPGGLNPGNYPGGFFGTQSYIFVFMSTGINVNIQIEYGVTY